MLVSLVSDTSDTLRVENENEIVLLIYEYGGVPTLRPSVDWKINIVNRGSLSYLIQKKIETTIETTHPKCLTN